MHVHGHSMKGTIGKLMREQSFCSSYKQGVWGVPPHSIVTPGKEESCTWQAADGTKEYSIGVARLFIKSTMSAGEQSDIYIIHCETHEACPGARNVMHIVYTEALGMLQGALSA